MQRMGTATAESVDEMTDAEMSRECLRLLKLKLKGQITQAELEAQTAALIVDSPKEAK